MSNGQYKRTLDELLKFELYQLRALDGRVKSEIARINIDINDPRLIESKGQDWLTRAQKSRKALIAYRTKIAKAINLGKHAVQKEFNRLVESELGSNACEELWAEARTKVYSNEIRNPESRAKNESIVPSERRSAC